MPPKYPNSIAVQVVACAMTHAAFLEADLALPRVREVGVVSVLNHCRAYAAELASRFRSVEVEDDGAL